MYGICKSKHLAFRYHYHDALKIFVILTVHSLCFSHQKLFCSFIIGVLLQLVAYFSKSPFTRQKNAVTTSWMLVRFKWSTQRRLDGTSLRGLGSTKERREKLSRAYNNELPLVRLLNVSTSFKWNAQLGLGGTSPRHHNGTSPRYCAGAL